jgi:hypothetical protein
MHFRIKHIVSIAAATVVLLPNTASQKARATLNGRVDDVEHAAITHAKVTAKNDASSVGTAVDAPLAG